MYLRSIDEFLFKRFNLSLVFFDFMLEFLIIVLDAFHVKFELLFDPNMFPDISLQILNELLVLAWWFRLVTKRRKIRAMALSL